MDPARWRRIEQLYQSALDLPPADRSDFLLRACGHDDSLRQEVESLLEQPSSGGVLDRRAWDQPKGTPDFVRGPALIGAYISHYRIVEELGAGGMGEVFVAEDLHLARRVAIKFPALLQEGSDAPARFLKEARAASRLDHANIARIYDYGEANDGRPFLVMELVHGVTLHQALRDGPLSPERSVAVAVNVVRALREAHRAGLVHRDIKPSNVMLTESGEVKVLDFGLAKEMTAELTGRLSQAVTASASLTLPGVVRGTPAYMSPEQVRGQLLDGRSDLFSAGVLLYECLTGRPPFSGGSTHDVLEKVLYTNPPSPSFHVPAVPSALDRITVRAIAKEPAGRYQTAEAMLAELESAGTALSLPATQTGITAIIGSYWKWAAGAVLAVVLIAGSLLWQNRPHIPPPGAMRWYETGVAALRDGTYYRAARALEQAIQLDSGFALAHARLAEALNEMDDEAGANRELVLALPDGGSPRRGGIEDLHIDAIRRTLVDDFSGAIRTYTELIGNVPDAASKAALFVDVGRVREMNQENAKALAAYREAIKRDSQNAAAHLRAGILLAAQLGPQAAAEFTTAEALYRASSNTEGEIEVLYQRGYDASRGLRLTEARADLERAAQMARTISSVQQEIAALLQLSIVTYREGDPASAEKIAASAVQRARRGGMTFLAGRGLLALGGAQFGKQAYARAEANFQEALEISRNSKMGRTEARALFWLANLHETTGAADAALKEIDLALAYYEKAGFRVETRLLLAIKGRIYRNLGRFPEAVDLFRQLLALASASQDRNHMAIAEQGIARALFRNEDWPGSLEHFQKYNAIGRSIPDAETIGRSLVGEADVLWRLGRPDEAERLLPEVERLSLPVSIRAALAANVADRRAGIAFSRGRNAEAAALARRVSEMPAAVPPMPALAMCLAGVALARSGSAKAGKEFCEKCVAELMKQQDRFLLSEARIDLAEVLLANGEAAAVANEVRQALDVIDPPHRLESSWRAWVIAARAYRRIGDRVHAGEALVAAKSRLAALRANWTADYFNSYSARLDLARSLADLK